MNEHNLAHVKPFHHVKCDAYKEQSRKAKPESECVGSGLGRYAARPQVWQSQRTAFEARVSGWLEGSSVQVMYTVK